MQDLRIRFMSDATIIMNHIFSCPKASLSKLDPANAMHYCDGLRVHRTGDSHINEIDRHFIKAYKDTSPSTSQCTVDGNTLTQIN